MKREIGSNFWFSPEDIKSKEDVIINPDIFGCSGTDYVWLSSCRSAISLVIETIELRNPNIRKTVCLPAFTCHTVYRPFINKGYQVVTLPVEEDLTISAEKAIKVINDIHPGIVLFHQFFGFETLHKPNSIIKEIQNNGSVLIEDLTQSMYSTLKRLPADYFVGSIRKWCGVVDGGFAVCKKGTLPVHPSEVDSNLESITRKASELKYRYILGEEIDKKEFLNKYGEAKKCIDNQNKKYSICPLSQIIQSNLDIKGISEKRRNNYETLLHGIMGIEGIKPLYSTISPRNVPLYFPIICHDRIKLQKLLAKHNIYAPIIWPKEEDCPPVNEQANFLYDNMLCIPIDQRYDFDDMNRIINTIKECTRST